MSPCDPKCRQCEHEREVEVELPRPAHPSNVPEEDGQQSRSMVGDNNGGVANEARQNEQQQEAKCQHCYNLPEDRDHPANEGHAGFIFPNLNEATLVGECSAEDLLMIISNTVAPLHPTCRVEALGRRWAVFDLGIAGGGGTLRALC